MDSHLKHKLPQEGTHSGGQSLPDNMSGCSSDSGGSINQSKETPAVESLAASITSFSAAGARARSNDKLPINRTGTSADVQNTHPLHRVASEPLIGKTVTLKTPQLNPKKTNGERNKTVSKIEKLDTEIQMLQDYCADRHNVHQEIKRMLIVIKASCEDLAKDIRPSTQVAIAPTQTELFAPQGKGNTKQLPHVRAPGKQLLPENDNSPKTPVSEKRQREGANSGISPQKKRNRQEQNSPISTESTLDKPAETPVLPDWTKVTRKRSTKAIPSAEPRYAPRSRPDAIMVESVGSTSYADILRKVKSDPKLAGMGDQVARIRRTQNGHMLFELKRNIDVDTDTYQGLVESSLGGLAKVKIMSQEIYVVCKDMDEITTKEDLLKALKDTFDMSFLQESAVKSLRAAYGGTQTAIIALPLDAAKRVLLAGKLKVGWTVCRIREYKRTTSCFRCLESGHIAKACKGIDRSKMCRKCGEEGHIARNCSNTPSCMLCVETPDQPSNHIMGSSGCPKNRSTAKTARA